MKKTSVVILVLILAFGLTALFVSCNKEESTKETTTVAEITTTEKEAEQSDETTKEADSDNPVKNFEGKYDNGGTFITVTAVGKNGAEFVVDNPLTDDEGESYTFSGEYNADKKCVQYSNSTKEVLSYDSEGIVTDEETVYSNGSGEVLFMDNGTIQWQDENEAEWLVGSNVFKQVK